MKQIILGLLLFAAFAGCVSDEPETTQENEEPVETHIDETHNETGNAPPQVTLALNHSIDDAWLVNFTLNATDAEGDFLVWEMDVDGDGSADADGTSLPATLSFGYKAAGSYNVSAQVSDGFNVTYANTTVTLEPKIVPPAYSEQLIISGTSQLACPQCSEVGANTGAGYRGAGSGVDSVFAEVPAIYAGAPFVATSDGEIDLVFRDSCEDGGAVGDPFQNAGGEAGAVPVGAACVLMWTPDTPGATLTITIG